LDKDRRSRRRMAGISFSRPDSWHAVSHVKGVQNVAEIRVRWLGHRLHAEVNVAVDEHLSVEKGHEIAHEVRHQLLHHLKYLSNATIHIDPAHASGEDYHHITNHAHDNLPGHSH
jgi:divalent metal cation (Fe/Co/Zn/Cd) transporter